MVDNDKVRDLLQKLILARGPVGQEDEVAKVCEKQIKFYVDEFWVDASDNLIGKLNGVDSNAEPVHVVTHMDELSLIVKRVDENGTLRLEPLGGILPANMGQGVVDVMGDTKTIPGILSFGSMHVTAESTSMNKQLPKQYMGKGETPAWEDVHVITRKSSEELENIGVRAGTRVVISQSRRQIQTVEDCWSGYFMDNRAAIATSLLTLMKMKERGIRPKGDVYFVATTAEEIGALGACYAARTLPGDISVAIDVGPVATEYQTELNDEPIIVYKDSRVVYDKKLSDKLFKQARGLGYSPKAATFGRYGSDSSIAKMYGQIGRNALICIPTENTHGYEVIHQNSIEKCSELLLEFLT